MLSVMLSVANKLIMLSVIMLNVIILSVLAPLPAQSNIYGSTLEWSSCLTPKRYNKLEKPARGRTLTYDEHL